MNHTFRISHPDNYAIESRKELTQLGCWIAEEGMKSDRIEGVRRASNAAFDSKFETVAVSSEFNRAVFGDGGNCRHREDEITDTAGMNDKGARHDEMITDVGRDRRNALLNRHAEYAKFDFAHTPVDQIDLPGSRLGEVDDAALNERTPVVDANVDAAAVVEVLDPDDRTEGEGAVGGSEMVLVEPFAGRGLFAVESRTVPRRDAEHRPVGSACQVVFDPWRPAAGNGARNQQDAKRPDDEVTALYHDAVGRRLEQSADALGDLLHDFRLAVVAAFE